MDRFINIDWNPLLEDIVDNTFINEERLENESVMHRIMKGTFVDPFKNIEEDYKDVKTELMEGIELAGESDKEADNGESNQTEKINPAKETNKLSSYVPGIVKPLFNFPKRSNLSKEQQAMCLRVLLRFSESDKPKLSQTEREEVHNYMDLQKQISKEQDEFLEFAKSKWPERSFKITCEDYINLRWKSKLHYILKLPRYYSEATNIPFVGNKSIQVKFISTCLQMGQLPKIKLPALTRPYMLRINSAKLKKRFLPKNHISNESPVCFKLPVSEDPNCQKLAEDNNVDLVISSSGLNCLVNNIGPNYSNSWILPLVIKRHNDKNVIYIDKAAPPVASTIPEKNTWVYKYILKHFLILRNNTTSKGTIPKKCDDNDIFDDTNCEELLKQEDKYESVLTGDTPNVNTFEENESTKRMSKQENFENSRTPKDITNDCVQSLNKNSDPNVHDITTGPKDKNSKLHSEDNVSYNLFTIGPQASDESELIKNTVKEYKMLVRTKIDGFEILQNKIQRLLLIAPKLEHQTDFGAESVTLEEALKQWISLMFRPHTFLARVRLSAYTSEVLQLEHRTVISINNEIKRLYNLKAEDSLTVLHNVIQYLANLSPGRYIMRHTVRNGAFATIYKEVECTGKNVLDMHTIYGDQYHTLLQSPWILLDKITPTPMLKCFERMPVMFYPVNNKTYTKRKKSKKGNKTNAETVRRSLRNKK